MDPAELADYFTGFETRKRDPGIACTNVSAELFTHIGRLRKLASPFISQTMAIFK
jgi:hypothetical protein